MPSPKTIKQQYLRPRGGVWYFNYPIPQELRHVYLTSRGKPKDHIVKSLDTSDLNLAYRKKLELIRLSLAEFDLKRQELSGVKPSDLQEALAFRRDYIAARQKVEDLPPPSEGDDGDLPDATWFVESLATDRAEELFEAGGRTKKALQTAQTFYKVATGAETLHEACEDWLAKESHPVRTQAKYRTAVHEFLTFLGEGHHLVAEMNRKNAIAYVDWLNSEGRSQRTSKVVPLSYNTKRDRIMALSAFWNQYLSRRGKVSDQVNPWSNLKPTQRPTASDVRWDHVENTGRPQKRQGFTDAELLAILSAEGPAQSGRTRYSKATLMEVFGLGLLTGARPEEICSLRLGDVREQDGAYWLNLVDGKNADSDRLIPVTHPLARAVIARRVGDRKDEGSQLFSEFRPKKGHDGLYELVGRALARHLQRASGISATAVPYCTRHTLQSLLGSREDVNEGVLQRYVGHRPTTIMDRHYRTIAPDALLGLSRKIRFSPQVEERLALELGLTAD